MADNTSEQALQVSAEERLHPALRKLARAFIALQRWRQSERAAEDDQTSSEAPPRTVSEAGDGGA